MKFSFPSSSLPASSLSELQSLDREYRETVGAFGLDPRLQRPKGDFGLLLLPWSGGRVLLGFVLPYQDAHGRPNISLVGCVLDEGTTGRLSPERAAALLWQKNPIAALGRGGVRPDDLVLSDAEPLASSSCPAPALAWPTRDDGVLWIDGTALPLHRKEEASLPTDPGGRVKPSRLPRYAALLGLALGAVLLVWHALPGASPPKLPQKLSFLNNIASEDVSDIFFTKAFVGEKKKEIAAESLFNEGNEGKKWRANLFTVNNENEILVKPGGSGERLPQAKHGQFGPCEAQRCPAVYSAQSRPFQPVLQKSRRIGHKPHSNAGNRPCFRGMAVSWSAPDASLHGVAGI